MKKVSAAYEKDDLATLLQMEMEWLQKETDHLSKIPEDKLKLYVQVLKDQVKELQSEKTAFRYDERYAHVAEFGGFKMETGFKKIRELGSYLQYKLDQWMTTKRTLLEPNSKNTINSFVEGIVKEINIERSFPW